MIVLLATFRVMSCRVESNELEETNAVFCMVRGNIVSVDILCCKH